MADGTRAPGIEERLVAARDARAWSLDLSDCGLTTVPSPVRELTHLIRLVLDGNRLVELPAWIGDLTCLTHLRLGQTGLTRLPESLGDLTGLHYLGLEGNGLTRLPDSFRALTELTRLDLDGNRLARLPEWFGDLVGLVQLGLRGNDLTRLPETFGHLTRLTDLDLGGNRLVALPESFGRLTGLTRLHLDHNQLDGLPASFGQLTRLTHLGIADEDVTASASLADTLTGLSLGQLVVAGTSGTGPRLWALVGGRACAEFLRGPFPPRAGVPEFPPHLLAALREIAAGMPGDPVAHGTFPRPVTKLARLALARWRHYPADQVLRAAEHAYDRDRPYHAHDALACALVHPDVDAVPLAGRYATDSRTDRGERSRHKTHQVLAWARREGYLGASPSCPCGHGRLAAPTNERAALALVRHWDTVQDLLTVVARDPDRWLGVLRCTRCHRYWAEDSLTSGQAALFYGYPVRTRDPYGWLARASPRNLPPD